MSGIEIKINEEEEKIEAYKEMDKEEEKKSRRPQRTG